MHYAKCGFKFCTCALWIICHHFKPQKFPLTQAENFQRQNGRCQINLCSSIRLLPGWWFPYRVWLLHREDIASITAMMRTDMTAGYEDFLCLLGISWDKSKSYRVMCLINQIYIHIYMCERNNYMQFIYLIGTFNN